MTGITQLRMTVVDISDSDLPAVVGTTGVVAGASQGSSGIVKKGDYVFFGTAPSTFSSTLYVYDVSNPAAPTPVTPLQIDMPQLMQVDSN